MGPLAVNQSPMVMRSLPSSGSGGGEGSWFWNSPGEGGCCWVSCGAGSLGSACAVKKALIASAQQKIGDMSVAFFIVLSFQGFFVRGLDLVGYRIRHSLLSCVGGVGGEAAFGDSEVA